MDKRKEQLIQYLKETERDETVIFENPSYSTAVIGITEDERLIYDYDKMVEFLVETDDMNEEEAYEFIDYNTIRALPYMGDKAPIIMFPIDYCFVE